jgi:hypothetical protein
MKDYLAAQDRAILERHGLARFEALWTLRLQAVDEPNTERGGWSSVYRLALDEAVYYLKRQSNYLTHTLAHPFGEPTFAREFRNIRRYAELGIPALQAAFFAERRVEGERRAVLLTRALDGWQDLAHWLREWPGLSPARRGAILRTCGGLARQLHAAGQVHGCFYPKHIFLREQGDGFAAQLIDLEKTRPLLFGRRDRIKDLEPLLRRANAWDDNDARQLLAAYLGAAGDVGGWLKQLSGRRRHKDARR